MHIGEKIAFLRKERGIMQHELSEELGLTRTALSHIEHGRRTPTLDTIVKITKIFNVSADYLIDDDYSDNSADVLNDLAVKVLIDIGFIKSPDELQGEKRKQAMKLLSNTAQALLAIRKTDPD